MSYSEQNGQVVLTMSREDYDLMLLLLGAGTAAHIVWDRKALEFLNRLNEGNQHYTPYQMDEKKS